MLRAGAGIALQPFRQAFARAGIASLARAHRSGGLAVILLEIGVEPFVGAAGQLLTRMLGEIGLGREDVYITNVLRCRPPGNRDPLPDEIESCTPWLIETISIVQPLVVVTLGNFATKFVLNTQRGITSMRGSVYDWHGRKVIPTFHPAAILHGGGEKSRQFVDLQDDFALIRATLDAAARPEPIGSPAAPPLLAATAQDEQLELF